MYVSSGLRHTIGLAATWAMAGALLVAAVVWHSDLKAAVSNALGLAELQAEVAALQERAQSQPGAEPGPAVAGTVELKADRSGHFAAEASINGSAIEVLVDTGATMVALTWEDAERAGIFVKPSDFTGSTMTANGQARVAPVMISEITIGEITVTNVRGTVSERGRLSTTLLGMSFLGKLSRAEMRRDTLVLER